MLKLRWVVFAAACIAATSAIATPLHEAVRTGDEAAVRRLLSIPSGPSLREARDGAGRTPLLLATELNRVTIAGDIPVGTDGKQSQPIQGDSSTYSVVAGLS